MEDSLYDDDFDDDDQGYAPLFERAGFTRLELLPRLTENLLISAGVKNPRDRSKIIAGARLMGERAAKAGTQLGGGSAVGGSTDAGGDDYFKATRLHYDKEEKGFWAEDGTRDEKRGQPNRDQRAAAGAVSSTDDEGEDGPDTGGARPPSSASGRGGRGSVGRARGGGRGRGGGQPPSQPGGRSGQHQSHSQKAHGQKSRAAAKQGRPAVF
ncbi:hypothetical protein T492DRAFT_1045076 [Pavlovales sp. CCMP2436]|nr:hypothetical protein T492DRAFT_1045076 [Pavlovales sp. CCMP2436]